MFPFGVTFYPDLLPKEEWEKNFLKISEAGFNTIRFGEMAWGLIEPKDGSFNFEDFDRAMDLANKYGLKVVLGIPAAQAPQWLIAKYPDVLPRANDGMIHPEYGPRPNACKDNRTYKKLVERMASKVSKRYANHPALLCWQIDNEPSYPPLDLTISKDFCHCENTKKAFIEWAKEKYETTEKLNEMWGGKFWSIEFSQFEDISTPKVGFWDGGNPHIYLDWFRFKSDMLSRWLKDLKDIVKKQDQGHKIGTNSFIGVPHRIPDHDVIAEDMDWYGWDIYPRGTMNMPESLAQHASFWRSVCEGRGSEFIVAELQGGPNVRWGYPGEPLGKEIRTWAHQFVAHGAKGILFHAWRPPQIGSETAGFGLLNSDGSRTDRLEKVEVASKEIKKIEGILKEHKLMPRVAIAYLKSSEIETYQEQGPPRSAPKGWIQGRADLGLMHGLDSVAGAHRVLWRHLSPAAFVFERSLDEATPAYQAILLPNPYVLKEKTMKVLKKYVYDGGILITESRFGMKDENARLYDRPLMEKFFDVTYERSEIIEDNIKLDEIQFNAGGYRDIVKAKEGVILTYKDGHPALIEKKIGRGKALYATFSLFMSMIHQADDPILKILREYLPKPPIEYMAGANVEVVYWEDSSPLLYVINHGDEEENVEIIASEKFKGAEDLLYGKKVDFNEGRIEFKLGERQVSVLHLLDK